MFINNTSHYIPAEIVTNQYFEKHNGLTNEWIIERSGIRERRKAAKSENTNTMAVEAVKLAINDLPYTVKKIDLIIGGTYSPYDTAGTLAHAIQHFLNLSHIPVMSVSSACSSFINAIEIVQGYFALGKAKKALVVVSEHNTAYGNVKDKTTGPLWGDGAATAFISKDKIKESDIEIIDVITYGAANVGKGMEGVYVRPLNGGITMPFGKDVFIYACKYMVKITKEIINKNHYTIKDIDYLIPHQANLRITKNIANTLNLNEKQVISNIQYLGNTGSASCAIGLSENKNKFQKGDLIVITVFGGGYSCGAVLLRC